MSYELTSLQRTALDPRLAVARANPVDALRGIGDPGDASAQPTVARDAAVPAAPSPATQALMARWPVGTTVGARVASIPQPGRVLVTIAEGRPDGEGSLEVELQWDRTDGQPPRIGQDLGFRVVAHRPTLTLEPLLARDTSPLTMQGDDVAMHVSHEARVLQAMAAGPGHDAGPVRFETPLVATSPHAASEPVVLLSHDDAHATSAQDASAALVPRPSTDPAGGVPPFVPILLQGPAWPGQPVELVLRRDAHDAELEDAVRDGWCGDVVIDLPALGRVTGHLSWSVQGLRVRVEADDRAGAYTLTEASPELAAALADADLRLLSLAVGSTA